VIRVGGGDYDGGQLLAAVEDVPQDPVLLGEREPAVYQECFTLAVVRTDASSRPVSPAARTVWIRAGMGAFSFTEC
jgi:hypothetical protein